MVTTTSLWPCRLLLPVKASEAASTLEWLRSWTYRRTLFLRYASLPSFYTVLKMCLLLPVEHHLLSSINCRRWKVARLAHRHYGFSSIPFVLNSTSKTHLPRKDFFPSFWSFLWGNQNLSSCTQMTRHPSPPLSKLSKTRHCKGNLLAWRRGLSWLCVAAEPRAAQTADCRVCVLM